MKKYILLLLLAGLSACSINPFLPQAGEEFFYVRNEGVDMPVWVKGNINSSTYIIFLMGGPGGESLSHSEFAAFQALEQQYRIVYFDQRSAGWAVGNPAPETYTPEVVARDTDMVVNVITAKYNPQNIFMLGVSWGGLLGTAYLTNSTRQAKIRGWIEVDGAHNWPLGMDLSIQWVTNYALSQIADSTVDQTEKDFWQGEISYYKSNPVDQWQLMFVTDWSRHVNNVHHSFGYVSEQNISWVNTLDIFDAYSSHAGLRFIGVWSWFTKEPGVWNFDTTVHMDQITLPSLILWGLNDGILPMALASNAYQLLGTAAPDKSISYFSNSGHSPYMEEPDQFVDQVTNFIEAYKI